MDDFFRALRATFLSEPHGQIRIGQKVDKCDKNPKPVIWSHPKSRSIEDGDTAKFECKVETSEIESTKTGSRQKFSFFFYFEGRRTFCGRGSILSLIDLDIDWEKSDDSQCDIESNTKIGKK